MLGAEEAEEFDVERRPSRLRKPGVFGRGGVFRGLVPLVPDCAGRWPDGSCRCRAARALGRGARTTAVWTCPARRTCSGGRDAERVADGPRSIAPPHVKTIVTTSSMKLPRFGQNVCNVHRLCLGNPLRSQAAASGTRTSGGQSGSGFARRNTARGVSQLSWSYALGLFLSRRGFSFLFGSTTGPSAAGVHLDFPALIGTKESITCMPPFAVTTVWTGIARPS